MSSSSVVSFSRQTEASELASMIRMLPPLPEVANKILVQFNDEFISGSDIADIVECDPAISARLFGLANSAYFGMATPVTDMREVVSRVLGPDTVRSLAFALATEQTFDINRCTHFDSRRFWHRSLHCASAAQRIARVVEDINLEVKDFAYLGGLCHNLGVLALACCYPEETSRIFDQFDREEDANFDDLCRQQFGLCVDDVTYELAQHWEMPTLIVEGYRHRSSGESADNLLAAILGASVKSARYTQMRAPHSDDDAASSLPADCALIEVPNFDEDLPYIEASTLSAAALGSDRDRLITQSRLQAMVG